MNLFTRFLKKKRSSLEIILRFPIQFFNFSKGPKSRKQESKEPQFGHPWYIIIGSMQVIPYCYFYHFSFNKKLFSSLSVSIETLDVVNTHCYAVSRYVIVRPIIVKTTNSRSQEDGSHECSGSAQNMNDSRTRKINVS